MKKLHYSIEKKIQNALSVCLIVDIWTNRIMSDFIGLGASLIKDRFQKELFIIGLTRMNGAHNAENIKQRVEYMINKYSFDKSKVHCKLNYHISNI